MEFRQVGQQDFLSKERDINVWFQGAVRAALATTEESYPDLTEEKAAELFTGPITALRDFYRSIMTEDAPADVLIGRLMSVLSVTDVGRQFLMNFAAGIFTMYTDCARRAVQKPGVSKGEIENSLKAIGIMSKLPRELADEVRPYLKVADGFGEYVPGMYKEGTEDEE